MAIEPTRWGVIYNPKAGSRRFGGTLVAHHGE